MTDKMSGEDSGLRTIWDEICVQVQHEESICWNTYDYVARCLVDAYIEDIPKSEQESIWIQTANGIEWYCEDWNEGDAVPICNRDIIDYITTKYVYSCAGSWSNTRIRRFLERSNMRD